MRKNTNLSQPTVTFAEKKIKQTFFCALPPLPVNAKIAGVGLILDLRN